MYLDRLATYFYHSVVLMLHMNLKFVKGEIPSAFRDNKGDEKVILNELT